MSKKDAINQSINQQSIISMAFLSIPDSFLSISLLFNERTGISFEIKVDEMSFGDTDTDTDNGQTCVYALVQEERRTKRSQWSTTEQCTDCTDWLQWTTTYKAWDTARSTLERRNSTLGYHTATWFPMRMNMNRCSIRERMYWTSVYWTSVYWTSVEWTSVDWTGG